MRSKKKPQKSRSEIYLINHKYMGEEPTKSEIRASEMKALSWYNAMCDRDDSKSYVKSYLEATGRKSMIKDVNRISDTWWPMYAGWCARLITLDPEHPSASSWKEHLERSLKNALDHITPEKVEEKKTDRPSIQDRVRDKVSDIIGDVEEILDGDVQVNMYSHLQKLSMPPAHAQKIATYYKPYLEELALAVHGDKEVQEGYKNYTAKQLKARMEYVASIIEDCERYAGVTKKTRAAVRKPKSVSVEKIIKNLKYQKESAEYKVASVAPEKVVGAQELWVFNTKYKSITVFRALDRGGLTVKGTSIKGYDEKTSASYKTGRQTEKIVASMIKGSKSALKKIADDLKPHGFNDRINENTILMRIVV